MDQLSDTMKVIIGVVAAAVVIGVIVAVVTIVRNRGTAATTSTFDGLDNAITEFNN